MLFTVQEMQNFFIMDVAPHVLRCTKCISCWINTMELSEDRVARKNELFLLKEKSFVSLLHIAAIKGKGTIAKALNKQSVRLGDKCVIVTQVKNLD
jgi:hypothetical protein